MGRWKAEKLLQWRILEKVLGQKLTVMIIKEKSVATSILKKVEIIFVW